MYKHAKSAVSLARRNTRSDIAEAALWHVGAEEMLFAGRLFHNARHSHAVPLFIAGLYDDFYIRLSMQRGWCRCRTAVIPAGVSYELKVAGNPLAVYYIEPFRGRVATLLPLVSMAEGIDGAILGKGGETELLRRVFEDRHSLGYVREALIDLLCFSERRASAAMDGRVAITAAAIANKRGNVGGAGEAARAAGISPCYFQRLFSRSVGVPFRRYRAWHRLRGAIDEIIAGENFTAAAHGAGYYDQAHFCRHFRQTFGAAPSGSLKRVRRG